MSDPEQRMLEDRALRDAARALFTADIAHVRNQLNTKSLPQRVLGRVGDGAKDVLEQAADTAENNRGTIALLLGAVVLWFARHPLMALFDDKFGSDNDS
ncbi:hypothetical protein IM511_00475 [Erythrobacteraceae bacterium E2-1 Yellow Sea]|nr:hypothetical protein [Erythrobacteraceae bacterium E2-1 Yellow Sea]